MARLLRPGHRWWFSVGAAAILLAVPVAVSAQGGFGQGRGSGPLGGTFIPPPQFPLGPGQSHAPTPEQLHEGETLFNQDWAAQGAPAKGDGIGPMYNARSCVQCHRQGGIGGGGDRQRNVDLLVVAAPVNQTRDSVQVAQRTAERAARIHPFLNFSRATVVLHQFGRDEAGRLQPYADWRRKLERHREVKPFNPFTDASGHGAAVYHVQRNTPALFGAGLIDAIPDSVLVETARQQSERGLVSGRISRVQGKIGRFGWRAQVPTLHSFVLGACANELGLSIANTTFDSALNPVGSNSQRDSTPNLSAAQCVSLTEFVASLPAPVAKPLTPEVAPGERFFRETGCAECHPRDLGKTQGIYSDLLLHDMGQRLEDPMPAAPEPVSSTGGFSGSDYYGSDILNLARTTIPTTRITQEWRTPPLWGLVDSAPYLHDGRAHDLDTAILLHGGEAEFSAGRYADLSEADRQLLLAFLATLDGEGKPVDKLPYD